MFVGFSSDTAGISISWLKKPTVSIDKPAVSLEKQTVSFDKPAVSLEKQTVSLDKQAVCGFFK